MEERHGESHFIALVDSGEGEDAMPLAKFHPKWDVCQPFSVAFQNKLRQSLTLAAISPEHFTRRTIPATSDTATLYCRCNRLNPSSVALCCLTTPYAIWRPMEDQMLWIAT